MASFADQLSTYLCVIRHFMLAAGQPFPSDHPQVRMLLRGIGRLAPPRRQKAPASVAILEACFSSLDLNDPADQALWGALCMAFFFLLRRSEIVATSRTTFCWFALKARDVTVLDTNGNITSEPIAATSVRIKLRGSKTNQNGAPVVRALSRSGHSHLCPVFGALLLKQSRGTLPVEIPAAVFMNKQEQPDCVSAARVAGAIQAAARAVGDNSALYSTYSLRGGGANNMYRAGIDALTIQLHGRWASDTFKLYTRLCAESTDSIASKIAGGARMSTVLQ